MSKWEQIELGFSQLVQTTLLIIILFNTRKRKR
jgi:hypothetical protein